MDRVWRLVLAGLLLTPVVAQAQRIHGKVVEDDSRAAIAGASVELRGPDSVLVARAQTDSTGTFSLTPGRAGSFSLRLRHLSYVAAEPVALEVGPAETVELELRMGRTAIPLEPVVVTVHTDRQLAGFYQRMRQSGFGYFLSREQIAARPASSRISDLLRTMPGVQVQPTPVGRGGPMTNLITMRGGFGRCLPTIYLDGMPVEQQMGGGVDEMLAVSMLEGVEVYPHFAGAPAALHARDGCGVVALWTRRDTGGRWSWRKLFTVLGLVGVFIVLTR